MTSWLAMPHWLLAVTLLLGYAVRRMRRPRQTNRTPYSLSLFIMFVLTTVYVGAAI